MPDGNGLTQAQVLDHIGDIVRVRPDRILPLRLVALSVSAQVDGHDPVPLGEVRGLRSEERAIARPPVHEHEGRLARASVLIG